MCGHPIVQETWREHHIVPVIPELNTILSIECARLSCLVDAASCENHSCAPGVDPQTSVVDWAIGISEESGANRPHDTVHFEYSHPNKVDHSESSVQSVSSVLSWANLDSFEESSNWSTSWSHDIVDEVLETTIQKVGLNSLTHFFRYN